MSRNRVILKEKFNPSDEKLKKSINDKADAKNYVTVRMVKGDRTGALCCGAERKGRLCGQLAGFGTDHLGYGRCKFHGGNNHLNKRSAESRKKTGQNARKHGFYSETLSEQENKVYGELNEKVSAKSLEQEIHMYRAKIITYLNKWRERMEQMGERSVERVTRYKENGIMYYAAGSIEDPVLNAALSELRKMIHAQAVMGGQTSGMSLLETINRELRDSSQVDISAAWGGRVAISRGGAADGAAGEQDTEPVPTGHTNRLDAYTS